MLPLITWYIFIQLLSITAFPICFTIFKNLKDKGYAISKIMGAVFVTYISYILSVIKMSEFGVRTIFLSWLILLLIDVYLVYFKRIFKKINLNDGTFWKIILTTEIVFLSTFLIFCFIRSFYPGIYGGESVYDLAYTNTLKRTDTFPPKHTWFSTANLDNYYYSGHLIIAVLSILTNVPTHYAYNLALALNMSLLSVICFSIVFNLTKKFKYAIFAVILIVFCGNLMGLFEAVSYLKPGINWYIDNYYPPQGGSFLSKIRSYNWWWPSRIIPGAIHEFPFWSFIWGDLHGHFLALPFRAAVILILVSIFNSRKTTFQLLKKKRNFIIPALLILSLMIGFSMTINIYDYPFLLLLSGILLFFNDLKISKGIKPNIIFSFLASILIVFLSFISFFLINSQMIQRLNSPILEILPHDQNQYINTTERTGIGLEIFKTSLYHFFVVFSLQILAILAFIFDDIYKNFRFKKLALFLLIIYLIFLSVVFLNFFRRYEEFYLPMKPELNIKYFIFDFQLLALILPTITWSLFKFLRTENRELSFILILLIFSCLYILICELVNLEGRYVFMNKVYGTLYITLGIISTYFIYLIIKRTKFRSILSKVSIMVFFIIFLSYLVFPIFSTLQKTNLLTPQEEKLTLNGIKFLNRTHPNDYKAIKWINKNIEGTPTILEAPGRPYQYTSRVSVYTGLPTVLGSTDHMELHLAIERGLIDQIWREMDEIYNTNDNIEALDLLEKYEIDYIYIGELEKYYNELNIDFRGSIEDKSYSPEGLKKFSKYPEHYTLIYNHSDVQIYEVNWENILSE
ncbi:MAG: hypothetical protein GF368_05075 [Candidatus Aenigmarchaeota archaeon]|nr:hypothetical protein [Candidatus Aenigmarchaeota archaeon]